MLETRSKNAAYELENCSIRNEELYVCYSDGCSLFVDLLLCVDFAVEVKEKKSLINQHSCNAMDGLKKKEPSSVHA